MGDLTGVSDTLPVRLGGVSSTSGIPDNYADVNAGGSLQVAGQGTAGTPAGGVVSIQGISGGTAIPVTASNFPVTVDTNYGTIGSSSLRVAAQIGNATGIADFNTGNASAQTLRVVLPTNQTGINTFLDKTGSGTITTLNGTVVATTNGCSSVTFDVTGTWVATITIQATTGDGNWFAVNGDVDVTDSIATTFTANTFVTVPCGSFPQVRLSATLFTSGTVSVNWDAGSGSNTIEVFSTNASSLLMTDAADGPVTPGTVASKSNLIGGQYNSTLPTLTTGQQSAIQVDSSGRILADVTGSVSSTPADLSGSGTITALNQTVAAVLHGCAAIVIDIEGTFSATIQLQATVNGGTSWFNIQGIYAPFNAVSGIWSAVSQIIISCGGYQQVRALCTSYTSGTMNIYWDASSGSNFTWSYVYNETPTNLQTLDNAYATTSSYPSPYNVTSYAPAPLNQDAFGNLQTRGPILTDEGSFRDDFSGTSLITTLSGTVDFINGSTAINGTGGTAFTTQVGQNQYIKISTDPETDYAQVANVVNDSSLMLFSPYAGSNNTGATAFLSNWATTTGSGSLTVASSILSIASGTVSGNTTAITRDGDYLPYSLTTYASISQRIANQATILGFVDVNNNNAAVIQFTGTTNTQVNFITAFSSAAADTQTTLVTLPNGATTAASNQYVIDLGDAQATLSINGIIVAVNLLHLPGPYAELQIRAAITNSATVTTTTLAIDNIYFENIDRVQVANDFAGEGMPVIGNSNSGQADNNSAPVKIGGVYNTTVPSLSNGNRGDIQIDSRGAQQVTLLDGARATYSACSTGLVPVTTTPSDVFTITGSATKTIRITKVRITGTQVSVAAIIDVLLIKRSAANTGGTSTAPIIVPHDSNNAAATATVLQYTANPSALGAAVGTIRSTKMVLTVPNPGTAQAAVASFPVEFDFGNRPAQAIVLRGITQVLAISLNSVTLGSAGSFDIHIEWSEE